MRNHWRCGGCGELHFDYPMIVVTTFVANDDRLLWVQRGIEPQRGTWAIPGGFMELNETLAQAAARELHEEAGILLPPEQLQLYMTGTITFINQVQGEDCEKMGLGEEQFEMADFTATFDFIPPVIDDTKDEGGEAEGPNGNI